MKTIWLINQYASTPETGIGGRHHYLARELAALGHKVYVIAAQYHHLLKDPDLSASKPVVEQIDGYNFVRLPVPQYQNAHNKKRILNWLLFTWKVWRLHNVLPERPDAILASSPAPFVYLGARRQARKHRARLAFEVRDFWPLTLIELGGKSPKNPLIRFMQWLEDHAYRTADCVVSNVPDAVRHMQAHGLDPQKFTWVSNGVALDEVSAKIAAPSHVVDAIPKDKFVVGYAGTIGLANSMDTLLDVAIRLKDNPDIVFALLGDGRAVPDLKAVCAQHDLKNVLFLGRVNKDQVQDALARFDATFLAWKISPLYNFGIAANKIFDYLYAGKPMLHAYSGALDPVAKYDCGFTVPAEDPAALANAVLQMAALPQQVREEMGTRGRVAALEHHEYGALARKLEIVLVDA